ncbi:cytochrome c oxidase subunit 3 [Neorhodopirellula lusitana]|uniref:cytochrome c oxidase subunit 3 n=1 Tax=Neorhodopirellula lusitana TaxID=445327 RepID=UPI00384EFB53
MPNITILPNDQRYRQGGILFLGTLFIFFVSSLVLYGIYAYTRQNDAQSSVPLPMSFLTSTICLIGISGLVHWATRAIRRSRLYTTAFLLAISGIAGVLFMAVQYASMRELLTGPAMQGGTGKGVAGMVVVLAFLHALHIAGGVIALGIVSVRAALGKYDRERHWPVDFAAQYWHFLDVIWLMMLGTFAMTTGGF